MAMVPASAAEQPARSPDAELPLDAGRQRDAAITLPERASYRLKRRVLGPPMTNDQLRSERLSTPVALGVLAPDCISSSAYGTEEILIELLPFAGVAAFALVLPITGVILLILLLLTLSYREVVEVYTKAGGSYVVARENFGPRVAQIAAVALLIDYVVTVAVQTAAGTVAVVSAIPALGPYTLEITVGVVLLLSYGNLRGIKEAGRVFAFPTYFFTAAIGSVIVVGIARAVLGNLPRLDAAHLVGAVHVGHGSGLVEGATVLVLLRAFANGGSSLTGLEAISNGVSTFKAPEGLRAKRAMLVMACTLGFLVAGVSVLAHLTHATPYASGYPSVISQEARLVFGSGLVGHVLYAVVQTATAMILYTGGNTSFNGFPYLASFVADDAFLPRQLRRRGHRLVFSNAIVLLTVISIALLVATDAKVNSLVPFYAIGVFTGFTMAGFGMARYHNEKRGPGWRHRVAINFSAGSASLVVVAIFAIAKFTQGAWLVVIVFPVMVALLIRLNRQYREEQAALEGTDAAAMVESPVAARHIVLVLIDSLDLATLEALRYGRNLRPFELRAVHIVLDTARADRIERAWQTTVTGVSLELVDCPDRRFGRALLQLLGRVSGPRAETTVLLPRRTYSPILGRLLHDRTADRIARLVSRVPNAAATIIPFDIEAQVEAVKKGGGLAASAPARVVNGRRSRDRHRDPVLEFAEPAPPAGCDPMGTLQAGQVATVQGRVRSVQLTPLGGTPVLACEVVDATGTVTALFYGRRSVGGIEPGAVLMLTGRPTEQHGKVTMNNPRYDLLAAESG